ncbi:hypothetical protein GCM10027048_45560 [Hymenobacter coalescens]
MPKLLRYAALLLAGLGAAPGAAAQQFLARGPRPLLPHFAHAQDRNASLYIRASRPALVAPDAAYKRVLARNGVKAVLKVRLNSAGQVTDTVGGQQFDPQGQLLRTWLATGRTAYLPTAYKTPMAGTRRVVRTPAPADLTTAPRAMTRPTASAPAEQLAPDESHVAEELPSPTDSVLTYIQVPIRTKAGVTGHYHRFRYAPHPDTMLYLQYSATADGRLRFSAARYGLLKSRRPVEAGRITARQAQRQAAQIAANPQRSIADAFAPMLHAVRGRQGLEPYQQWRYNNKGQLVHEEAAIKLNAYQAGTSMPQVVTTKINYTYNSLGQLIGRQETFAAVRMPTRTAYRVFSYLPSGLLAGETSKDTNDEPIFYRYQYEYYPEAPAGGASPHGQ